MYDFPVYFSFYKSVVVQNASPFFDFKMLVRTSSCRLGKWFLLRFVLSTMRFVRSKFSPYFAPNFTAVLNMVCNPFFIILRQWARIQGGSIDCNHLYRLKILRESLTFGVLNVSVVDLLEKTQCSLTFSGLYLRACVPVQLRWTVSIHHVALVTSC